MITMTFWLIAVAVANNWGRGGKGKLEDIELDVWNEANYQVNVIRKLY